MSSFIEGTNRITTVIVNRDTTPVAQIATCLGVEYTPVLNDAGAWSARFPANDPRVALVQLKKHFLDFYVDGRKLVRGLVEKQSWELSNDGQQLLLLSGRDLLAELDEVPINFALITTEEGTEPTTLAPFIIETSYNLQVIDFSGASALWIIVPTSETESLVYAQLAGETALRALQRVSEQTGESFRLITDDEAPTYFVTTGRGIVWLGTTTESSGVRAIGGAGDSIEVESNFNICLLQSLRQSIDATRMIARIYAWGSGLGETRLDLVGTTRSAPTGFTYDAATNSITKDATLTYVGKLMARHVNFKEIRPLFNTDADIQYAKDFLFDAALAYLQRNDDVDDVVEYDLEVLQLPAQVRVGMTLRVQWQDDLRTIDTDFIVLAISNRVGSNGEITYSLKVATQNQWCFRENDPSVSQMEEGEIFGAHPQIDAIAYWMPFRELVGDDQIDHVAEMHFWLSAEIVTIRQVLFRYRIEQALIAVRSYSHTGADTGQNAAADTGSTAVTTAGTAVTTASTAVTTASTAVTTASAAPNTGDTNAIVGAAGSTAIGAASPDAFTDTNYLGLATATQPPVGGDTSSTHHHDIGTHVHDFAHTHVVDAEHGHSTSPHSHTTVAHTHTSTAHTHTSTAHTHTSAAHTHTSAAHAHSSPVHTHAMATLTFVHTPERIPALNTYAIADLEYSVNGGSWVSLNDGVPVAGGYSEFDITSEVQNPAGLKRPYQEYNVVQVRRTTAAGTGKSAQVRAQVGIRATIQSIVIYE